MQTYKDEYNETLASVCCKTLAVILIAAAISIGIGIWGGSILTHGVNVMQYNNTIDLLESKDSQWKVLFSDDEVLMIWDSSAEILSNSTVHIAKISPENSPCKITASPEVDNWKLFVDGQEWNGQSILLTGDLNTELVWIEDGKVTKQIPLDFSTGL